MEELEQKRALLLSNLLDTMQSFATVRDTAEVWEDDGLLCVYSGMPGAVFNSVLLTQPVTDEKELRVKFDYVQAMYRQRRARWSLWLVEYLLPLELRKKLGPLAEKYSLRMVSQGSGMFVEKLAPVERALPKLRIEEVSSPASRFDFCHVMAVAFRTPLATFLDVYHTTDYWCGAMRGFVAYSGNRAVGTACVMAAHGVMGVYGVAVVPDVQRQGIGERTVRFALERVSRESGLESCVLESSDVAEGLYRRMGFGWITGVSVYNETR
jgi:ribosomal protein S18 acetylase RimI-like enzyme